MSSDHHNTVLGTAGSHAESESEPRHCTGDVSNEYPPHDEPPRQHVGPRQEGVHTVPVGVPTDQQEWMLALPPDLGDLRSDQRFLPLPVAGQRPADQKSKAVSVGVMLLAGIGLVMSMQSVSLMSGTGTLWTGVGLAAAGTAAAFFMGAVKPVRVAAALCLAASLIFVTIMENQLSQKRSEISDIFRNIPTPR